MAGTVSWLFVLLLVSLTTSATEGATSILTNYIDQVERGGGGGGGGLLEEEEIFVFLTLFSATSMLGHRNKLGITV